MAKPEWGSKRLCQSCGLKFYDLGKLPAICPDCDTEFKEVVAKRPAPPAAPKEAKKPPPKHDRRKRASTEDGESEELEDEIEDDDVDDDVDDEVDLDDEDDDDLKEVIEASSGG
ncbi:MAG: FYDLN acid domain-containing protein [Proteobacteria bacterium]|nr:FYDLN acid domain-containing protein [Pseudomonadota bacterium]MDA1058774.1 FYDLN acid domain-containing protein [Pseudomonadota bacterium]